MTYLYPGVVWGENRDKEHKCEVDNASSFATELGAAKGKFTHEAPEYQGVYTRTVYGMPH